MGPRSVISQAIRAPSASRQIAFHQLLVAARKTWLMDALSDALGGIDPKTLKRQLSRYVPSDVQQLLAAAGVRDEHVFPTPIILETKPTLGGITASSWASHRRAFTALVRA
jgi:hypothetical protein